MPWAVHWGNVEWIQASFVRKTPSRIKALQKLFSPFIYKLTTFEFGGFNYISICGKYGMVLVINFAFESELFRAIWRTRQRETHIAGILHGSFWRTLLLDWLQFSTSTAFILWRSVLFSRAAGLSKSCLNESVAMSKWKSSYRLILSASWLSAYYHFVLPVGKLKNFHLAWKYD